MQLANKVAVITGGASGQGQAACRLFAQAGARVVVADWNGTGAEQTAEEIRVAGGEAVAVPADISREADVEAMIHGVGVGDLPLALRGQPGVRRGNRAAGLLVPCLRGCARSSPCNC